jgi:hypothetical protein
MDVTITTSVRVNDPPPKDGDLGLWFLIHPVGTSQVAYEMLHLETGERTPLSRWTPLVELWLVAQRLDLEVQRLRAALLNEDSIKGGAV